MLLRMGHHTSQTEEPGSAADVVRAFLDAADDAAGVFGGILATC